MSSKNQRADSEPAYLLNRDYAACVRLNFQHYVWKKEMGFNLSPTISVPENARIAEVATGTSIWATEVAQEHPTASIDCLDISLQQAPPQSWLPENIRLHEWNMFDPNGPPAGLEGQFDVVHLRLVVLAFEDDATPLIRNLYKLLKPGGYLQWDENDHRAYHHVHPSITDSKQLAQEAPAVDRARTLMAERIGKEWFIQLLPTLRDHGFTDVKEDTYAVNRLFTKWSMDSLLMVWDEVLTQTPKTAPHYADWTQLALGVKAEAGKGHAITTGKAVIVAKKQA